MTHLFIKKLFVLFIVAFSYSDFYSQCVGCTSTNPTSLPGSISTGTIICITTNKTYGGGANLTGGSIRVCNGATLNINGAVNISSSSSITMDNCSKVSVNGSVNNSNPLGIQVMDNCNCATAFTNTGAFSGFAPICSPLPVELLEFKGTCNENSVSLQWTTASEVNNSHFIIDRSENGVDWQNIGTVEGNGNSNSIIQYEFIDFNPIKNNAYYQLTQVDYEHRSETFNPIFVSCSTNHETVSMEVQQGNVIFNVPESIKHVVEVKLINIQGQVLISKKISIEETNPLISVKDLRSGIYTVIMRYGDQINYHKLFLP